MSSPPKVPDPFDDPPRTEARGSGGTRVPVVSRISDRSWRSSASGVHELIPASSIWSRGTIAQLSPQGRTYDDDFISTRTLLVDGVDTQPSRARELHGNSDDPFSFGYPRPNRSWVLQDQYANTGLFSVGEPPHGSNTQFYLHNPLARGTRTMGDIQRHPVGQPYDPFHGTSFAGDAFQYGDPFQSTSFAGDAFQYGGSRAQQFVVEPPRPAVPHSFYGPFTSMFQPYANIQPYPVGETNRSAIPYSFYNPLTGTIQTYANVQQHPIGENGDRSSNPPRVTGALQMNGANAQSNAIFKPHRSAVPPTTYYPCSHNKPSFESFQQYLVGEPHVPDPPFNPSFAGGSLQARGTLAPPQFYPHRYGEALATQSVENTQTHPVREAQGFHANEWKNKNPESSSLTECDKNRITSKGKVNFQEVLTPLGTRCSLCNIDLAFEPDGSSDGRNHPIAAVMSCGHCYHVDCLELIGCPMQTCDDPPCAFCSST